MTKGLQKFLVAITSIALTFMYFIPVKAAMLENAKVTLDPPTAGQTAAYTFSMKTPTGGDITGIKMEFTKVPSGNSQYPTSIDFSGGAIADVDNVGISGTYVLDKTTDAGTGIIYLTKVAGTTVAGNATLGWKLSGIKSPGINTDNTGCNPTPSTAAAANPNYVANSAGTCFIKITLFNSTGANDAAIRTKMQSPVPAEIIDSTVIGFSVQAQATMQATVDPTLGFTVVGITSGTDIADAGAATTASATSTFSSLDFGYLTVGTPKTMGHSLYVKTNAQNGYSVKLKATTDSDSETDGVLKGQYNSGANNIDGYGLDDGPASWTTPTAWHAPDSSTANTNTGYLGVNSTDTDTVFTGGNVGFWAPLQNLTYNEVMKASGPDIGNTPIVVSYAIEVDVYQPADRYTGTFVYQCTPTY